MKKKKVIFVVVTAIATVAAFFLGLKLGKGDTNALVIQIATKSDHSEINISKPVDLIEIGASFYDDGTPYGIDNAEAAAEIKKIQLAETQEWGTVLILDISYTNKTDKASIFLEHFDIVAFQQGQALSRPDYSTPQDIFSFDGMNTPIKDGATIIVQETWILSDLDSTVGIELGSRGSSLPEVAKIVDVTQRSKDNDVSNPAEMPVCAYTGCNKNVALVGETEYCRDHANRCSICKAYSDGILCADCMALPIDELDKPRRIRIYTCEECENEATYSIVGLTGSKEFYCSVHYYEMAEILSELLD